MSDKRPGMTYAAAGVDVARKAAALRRLADQLESTRRPGVLGGLGAFGGLFGLDVARYPDPVLVSSADGVGSKLKVAFAAGRHDTVGIDLVAMNVDDIACQGAEPLFFLDYIGMGRVDDALLSQVVAGVAAGCRQAGCALIGGETAELPEFYPAGEYDLAGFAAGAVNRDRVIDGSTVASGDAVIGLGSSGLHSNGYTLARRVLQGVYTLADHVPELSRTLADELLEPTRIYARNLLALREQVELRAVAHITGGGLHKNVPRVLPPGAGIELEWGAWDVPPVFSLIARLGPVANDEMERTFNLGLGMVLVVPADQADAAVAAARALGEQAWIIGRVTDRPGVVVRRG